MAFSRSRGIKVLLTAAALLALGAVGGAAAFYVTFVQDLPDLRSVADYRPPLASHVYDRNGELIGEFFSERRRLTPLADVPAHVVNAFVAGEDSAFFEHQGIDYESILRAIWVNLRAGGEIRQGGSTITQQMVKGLLLSPERKYRRKVREMILARRIEERFTKQEILYLYLNQIYFGHGAYGIGEAARTYFGKNVTELTVSEGAMLAGLPKAPSRYSPYNNPDQAERRRLYVLERMLEEELIDSTTSALARAELPELLPTRHQARANPAAYFTEEVRRSLFEVLGGDRVLRSGLEIETTLDVDLQRTAVEAVRAGLDELSRRQGYRGPLRRVEAAEIPAELERLALENRLGGDEAGDEDAEEASDRIVGEAETTVPVLPKGEPLLGVVTAVEPKAKLARVGFAPDVAAVVRLRDVNWAREPNPSKAPYRVRAIEHVFEVGDVARFLPLDDADANRLDRSDPPIGNAPLVELRQDPIVQGALLSFEHASGDVLAMVGGYDFDKSQFNRVIQARRQPGSAFKPMIYGAALSRGYTQASIVFDRPVVYVDENSGFTWRPRNYGRAFYGPITLREALTRSVNNATVHLFRDVGVDYVIDYTRRLGIASPLNRDLSLALGSSDVSLLEITRAYAVFAAAGRRLPPIFIRRVTDRDGTVLLENVELGTTPLEVSDPDGPSSEFADVASAAVSTDGGDGEAAEDDPNRVIPPEEAYLVTDLLRAVVADPEGTGWRLRALRRPLAGKTGTTNDQGDAWFVGFSPDVVTGVWVGHDESRFLGWGETGSRAAAPIWVRYMHAALAERTVRDFAVPDSIVFARIDRKTGLLADSTSTDTVFQAFLAETEPTENARKVQRTAEGRRLLRMDSF